MIRKTFIILFTLSLVYGFPITTSAQNTSKEEVSVDQINWYTFEEAIKKNKKHKKKIFIDVYTDWCGWCKKMDKEVFADPLIVKYINENYYPVKLNAEYPGTFKYFGKEYTNPNPDKPRTPNYLAIMLLKNEMIYPSFVILDNNNEWLAKSKGYKKADDLLRILKYYGGNQHKIMSWTEFNNLKTI